MAAPRAEHTDGQRRVSRLDNVREGFDIRREVERVPFGRLVVDDVGFGVGVGHGRVSPVVVFYPLRPWCLPQIRPRPPSS